MCLTLALAASLRETSLHVSSFFDTQTTLQRCEVIRVPFILMNMPN